MRKTIKHLTYERKTSTRDNARIRLTLSRSKWQSIAKDKTGTYSKDQKREARNRVKKIRNYIANQSKIYVHSSDTDNFARNDEKTGWQRYLRFGPVYPYSYRRDKTTTFDPDEIIAKYSAAVNERIKQYTGYSSLEEFKNQSFKISPFAKRVRDDLDLLVFGKDNNNKNLSKDDIDYYREKINDFVKEDTINKLQAFLDTDADNSDYNETGLYYPLLKAGKTAAQAIDSVASEYALETAKQFQINYKTNVKQTKISMKKLDQLLDEMRTLIYNLNKYNGKVSNQEEFEADLEKFKKYYNLLSFYYNVEKSNLKGQGIYSDRKMVNIRDNSKKEQLIESIDQYFKDISDNGQEVYSWRDFCKLVNAVKITQVSYGLTKGTIGESKVALLDTIASVRGDIYAGYQMADFEDYLKKRTRFLDYNKVGDKTVYIAYDQKNVTETGSYYSKDQLERSLGTKYHKKIAGIGDLTYEHHKSKTDIKISIDDFQYDYIDDIIKSDIYEANELLNYSSNSGSVNFSVKNYNSFDNIGLVNNTPLATVLRTLVGESTNVTNMKNNLYGHAVNMFVLGDSSVKQKFKEVLEPYIILTALEGYTADSGIGFNKNRPDFIVIFSNTEQRTFVIETRILFNWILNEYIFKATEKYSNVFKFDEDGFTSSNRRIFSTDDRGKKLKTKTKNDTVLPIYDYNLAWQRSDDTIKKFNQVRLNVKLKLAIDSLINTDFIYANSSYR